MIDIYGDVMDKGHFDNDRASWLIGTILKMSNRKVSHFDLKVLGVLFAEKVRTESNTVELLQVEIARRVAGKQSNVSRSLKRLKEQKYISTQDNKYIIEIA